MRIENLKYNPQVFKNLFEDLDDSLRAYFDFIPADAREWLSIFLSSLEDTNLHKRGFQIVEADEAIGFLIIYLRNKTCLIRHLYMMRGHDRRKLAELILRHALDQLKSIEGVERFENSAFTFPEDYITNPLEALGFKTVQRINMILDPITAAELKIPDPFVISGIDEKNLAAVAKLACEVYKGSVDLTFLKTTEGGLSG